MIDLMLRNWRYIALVVCAMMIVACTTDTTCRQDMEVAMGVTLHADSLNDKGLAVKYTKWDSITVETVGSNGIGIVVDNKKGLSKLTLPMRPDTTRTAYIITFHEQTDTLFVEHTQRQYFVSLACGCAIYHTITNAWSTDWRVDSVVILNANVENAVQDNLRIYLHE